MSRYIREFSNDDPDLFTTVASLGADPLLKGILHPPTRWFCKITDSETGQVAKGTGFSKTEADDDAWRTLQDEREDFNREQKEERQREQKERRSSEDGRGHSGGGGGGGGDNGCAVLIGVVIVVAVVVWFIFAVVIPLVVINIAVIALIMGGLRKEVRKFLLPLSVAGAALVVADYNQGWLTKTLAGNVAFFAGLIPVFLYLNIFAGLIAAYFLISNFLNKRSPHEDGAGEFTRRNVITMGSLLLVGALTVGLQKVVDEQRTLLKEQMAAQAADQARRAEAIRIAERSRVEQRMEGEWSDGSARLIISREENKFRAEYPTSMGLQVLHGEMLADNHLELINEHVGKLLNPLAPSYQGDFDREAWIQLGADGGYLIVRFSQAKEGRSLVMNRITGNPDSRVSVAGTPKTPPAENQSTPVAPPKPTPKTHEELIAEIEAKIARGERLNNDEAILWNSELMKKPLVITTGRTVQTGTTIQIGGTPKPSTGAVEKLPTGAVITSRGESGVNIIYNSNPDAIPKPPNPGSLEALSEAIARGEEVVLKIKYDSAVYPYHYLHDGLVKVSKTAVTFSPTIGTDDFTVSPDKIIELVNQPQEASRVLLKVVVKNARRSFGRDIEGKKDFYFYNLGAVTVGAGPGGTGLSIACNGCDDSMNVVYALLQKVRGAPPPSVQTNAFPEIM